MTVIYKPVLIESAAQAEALPVGTVAIDLDGQSRPRQASIRVSCGWYCTGEVAADGSPWLAPYDAMVGDYALVPIEAEEEWEDDGRPVWNLGEGEATPADVDDYERRNGRRPSRRLVTPWEEA